MNPHKLHITIVINAALDARWSVWFEALEMKPGPGSATTLSGEVSDQAALHGYLERIRDLNLNLISVYVEEK